MVGAAGSISVRRAGYQDVERGARPGAGAGGHPNDRGRGKAWPLGVPRELPFDAFVDAGAREGACSTFIP